MENTNCMDNGVKDRITKIKNYFGTLTGKIDFAMVDQLLKKSSNWKYIWLSPCQSAERYSGFCGFMEADSVLIEKSIRSVTDIKGSYIAEIKLIGENEAFYMISDGNESGKLRWSCWDRNNADIKALLPFDCSAGKSIDALVVSKTVLIRNGVEPSSDKDKVNRGLGSASIKNEKLIFDNCYENGNLKCWFLGGSK